MLEKPENFMPWQMQISKEIIFKWEKVISTLQIVYAQNKLASLRFGVKLKYQHRDLFYFGFFEYFYRREIRFQPLDKKQFKPDS